MSVSRRMAWMIVSLVGLAILSAVPVVAADGGAKIAVVDVEKVFNDAPRIKQYIEELDVLRQSLYAKLDIRSKNLMLDDNEIKELIDLKLKPQPTEADKARIQALEKLARDRDDEYKKLSETKELNDQQKARLKELSDMQKKSRETGTALQKDYEEQFQSKYREMMNKADGDVRDAIKQIAEAEGYSLIIAKEAVLFGGTDITDKVIAKLDRVVK